MFAHTLRPNHSEAIPSRMVFVDCESDVYRRDNRRGREEQRLRLWCAESCKFWRGKRASLALASGDTPEQFWDWLWTQTSIDRPIWLWSHNAFVDATWLQLWEGFDAGTLEYQASVLESPPFIVWFRFRGRKCVWVDSLNWWRCSLAELGRSIGLEKGSWPGFCSSDQELRDYCREDVRILRCAVEELNRFTLENSLGMMRFTAPGQAFASWRHTHQGPWPRMHGMEALAKKERSAYFGGRCSLFYRGRVEAIRPQNKTSRVADIDGLPTIQGSGVYYFDAKSFYPGVMKSHEFPYRHVWTHRSISVDHLGKILAHKGAIAKVFLATGDRVAPVRNGDETVFQRGEFWATLAKPELVYWLGLDAVKAVAWCETYSEAPLFAEWVDRISGLRDRFKAEGNPVWAGLAKLLLNSLYGKFGQLTARWKDRPDLPPAERWGYCLVGCPKTGRMMQGRVVAGMVQVQEERQESDHAFVSIPATVTSWGRVAQQEWLDALPPRSCYYTDTDSLHVNGDGVRALQAVPGLLGDQVGQLGFREAWDDVAYFAQKCYLRDGKLVAAGISRQAAQLAPTSYSFNVWERMGELIARGPDGLVRIRCRTEDVSDWQVRGELLQDGWIVPPEVHESITADHSQLAPF